MDLGLDEESLEIFRSVTYIGIQKQNWAGHSGANGLMNITPARNFRVERPIRGLGEFLLWRIVMPLKKGKTTWYDPDSFRLELRVMTDMMRQSRHIYHYLSVENEYLLTGGIKNRGKNFLVGTFHLPVNRFIRIVVNPEIYQCFDAVLLVSSSMRDYYEDVFGKDRVHIVPLGTDTEYWSPADESWNDHKRSGKRVLFVGAHLRDFETLRRVIKRTNIIQSDIQFHVVVSKLDSHAFIGLPNVSIYTGISDESLRNLYRTCDVMICPLLECTASNTLLEAMACGLPMVVTDVGGVKDYVNPTCAILTRPQDIEGMTDALVSLINDPSKLVEMRVAARERGKQFDWKKLVCKVIPIYQNLLFHKR